MARDFENYLFLFVPSSNSFSFAHLTDVDILFHSLSLTTYPLLLEKCAAKGRDQVPFPESWNIGDVQKLGHSTHFIFIKKQVFKVENLKNTGNKQVRKTKLLIKTTP